MTPSEINFLYSLYVISVCSFIVKIVTEHLFYKTLKSEDAETIEKQLDKPIAKHTEILAGICFISGLIFFFHSAILVAVLIKEYL